jgi:AraC family L-rhamnose operon regulatory protein RhaS
MRSIGYWDAGDAQRWGLEWHKNEGIEICYLESGTLDFLIDGSAYELLPAYLTITRPWLSHKLGNPNVGPSRLHWFILDVAVRNPHQEWKWPEWIILNTEDLEELTRFLRQNEHPVWKTNKDIGECFIQMGKTVGEAEGGCYDSRLKIYINMLLVLLLDLFRKGDIELNERLTDTKRTVELFLDELGNHLQEEWTLERMADHCNLGVTQFSKYCKQITNTSPVKFLNSLRLKHARKLLKDQPDLSITDVGYRTGFSSPQYFATSFRRSYAMTPKFFKEAKPI